MPNLSEFSFKIEDHPGALASATEILGKAGINIDGCVAIRCEGKGIVHVVTNNSQLTASALKAANIKYETQDVLEVKLNDKPGEIAKLARSFGDAKINITTLYITMRQTIVLGFDDVDGAKKVLQKLANS